MNMSQLCDFDPRSQHWGGWRKKIVGQEKAQKQESKSGLGQVKVKEKELKRKF